MNDGFRRSLACEHAFVRIVGKACELSGAAAPAEVPQLTANFTVSAFQIVAGRARRALVGAGVVRGLIADDVLALVARVAGRVGAVALVERVVIAHGAVRGRRCAVGDARAAIPAIGISGHRARAAPAGHVHAGVVAAGGAVESIARAG